MGFRQKGRRKLAIVFRIASLRKGVSLVFEEGGKLHYL